jgi:hypothetical protein
MSARASRLNRGQLSRQPAIRARGTTFTTARTFVPKKVTERQIAKEFACVVVRFNSGELAQAADRSKDCIKGWRGARAAPNLASIINMCREMPAIWAWLHEQVEGGGAQIDDPRIQQVIRQEVAMAMNARKRE